MGLEFFSALIVYNRLETSKIENKSENRFYYRNFQKNSINKIQLAFSFIVEKMSLNAKVAELSKVKRSDIINGCILDCGPDLHVDVRGNRVGDHLHRPQGHAEDPGRGSP